MNKKSLLSMILFQLLILSLIGENWNIQVSVIKADCQDQYTFLGEDSLASNEYDNLDIVNWNPGITPWIDAYFPHPEWISSPGDFAADIRSNDLEEKSWILEIDSSANGSNEIEILFSGVNTLPEYYKSNLEYDNFQYQVIENSTINLAVDMPVNLILSTIFCPFINCYLDTVFVYYDLPAQVNLFNLFGYYGECELGFNYLENESIDQVIINSLLVISTNNEFLGLTNSRISAYAEEDTTSMDFQIQVLQHYYGDIDGNDEIDAYDASLVLQHIVMVNVLPELILQKANVDGNQHIDAYDASLILRYAVGYINEFPVRKIKILK